MGIGRIHFAMSSSQSDKVEYETYETTEERDGELSDSKSPNIRLNNNK